MIRILIHGCCGQMGKVLAAIAAERPDFAVAAGIDPAVEAGEFGFPVYKTLEACDQQADVIIDFSVAEAVSGLLDSARKFKLPLVIATTGLTDADQALLKDVSNELPLFQAANMSLGINLITDLIRRAAALLGDGFDIEIIEKHHNLKKDAPSGTAYSLANAVNQVFKTPKKMIFGRHTRTERRQSDEIGIHAVRGGTIVGEHQVIFAGKDEIVEISHMAHSRQVFAVGALKAAQFLVDKPAGLYGMQDMISAMG